LWVAELVALSVVVRVARLVVAWVARLVGVTAEMLAVLMAGTWVVA